MADDPKKSHAPAERAIVDARRAKADRVRERGQRPFANDVAPRLGARTFDIAEARSVADAARDAAGHYDEARVRSLGHDALFHVRGRIVAFRSTGDCRFCV